MSQSARLTEIRKIVQENGIVIVTELSKRLKVSPSTIRRDLKILEREELLERYHGGIAARGSRALFSEREMQNKEEKRMIGTAAARLIKDGDTVILDAGTTTAQIAQNVGYRKNVVVVTAAINIARLLQGKPGFKVILIGGLLHAETDSLVGVLAKETFSKINADIAFLGCGAISIELGIMYSDLDIAEIKRAIVKSSRKTILVADHSKFDKISLASIGPITTVDKVITDSKLPRAYMEAFRAKGIEVIFAE
jgi:DeoR/GlpR family transcriptional regulator of sugar metabolism